MSSFEPRRMPAWLDPVWDEKSVSHSSSRCVPSATHRASSGVLPSRIDRRRTGAASPSISRNSSPGTSVRTCSPERRATRSTTRSAKTSSSFTPKKTMSATSTPEATSTARSADPNESTLIAPGAIPAASWSSQASRKSTSTNPSSAVYGSRRAASNGARTAFRIVISRTTTTPPAKPSTETPGMSSAAIRSAAAAEIQRTSSCQGRIRGRSGRQRGLSP